MIPAGELDQRGQFQYKAVTVDALNQEVPTWRDYGGRTWVGVRPATTSSVEIANQMQAVATFEVDVRRPPRPGLSKFWRFVWHTRDGDRVLTIEGSPLPSKKYRGIWTLICSEGTRDNTEGAR